MSAAWMTPEELAAEMRPDADKRTAVKWVKAQMLNGSIPSVKVGNKRFFTPECRAEMERRALAKPAEDEGWSQVTRGRAS